MQINLSGGEVVANNDKLETENRILKALASIPLSDNEVACILRNCRNISCAVGYALTLVYWRVMKRKLSIDRITRKELEALREEMNIKLNAELRLVSGILPQELGKTSESKQKPRQEKIRISRNI